MPAFVYGSADDLLSKMSSADILELAIEGADGKSATEENLLNAFAELDGTYGGELTETEAFIYNRLLQSGRTAESRVNSQIAGQYTTPAIASDGTVPPEVKDAWLVYWRYKLYERRPRVAAEIVESYKDAKEWLMEVSRSRAKITLLDTTGAEEVPERGIRYGTTNRENVGFSKWL